MIHLPNPAVMVVQVDDLDEITDTNDPTTETRFVANTTVEPGEGSGLSIVYEVDGFQRGLQVPALEDKGDHWATPDGSVQIRAVDPYDAVILAPAAGIPQPVAAIRAALLSGGQLAQELDAVVAADNTVATLMLETSVGTYVRFSGDWQLLSPDSDALEDMTLVIVGPGAVDIWDAGEASRSTVNVSDLPVVSSRDGEDYIQEPSNGEGPEVARIPVVASAEDLPLAIRYAATHPDARWYVSKRAHALSASGMVPRDWQPGVVRPFVIPAVN